MPRLLLVLILLVAMTACRRESVRVVGVVPKGANHIFWQTVHAGAVKAGREYHFEIEWNAPTLEIDSSRQIEIVESMINRRLAGTVGGTEHVGCQHWGVDQYGEQSQLAEQSHGQLHEGL